MPMRKTQQTRGHQGAGYQHGLTFETGHIESSGFYGYLTYNPQTWWLKHNQFWLTLVSVARDVEHPSWPLWPGSLLGLWSDARWCWDLLFEDHKSGQYTQPGHPWRLSLSPHDPYTWLLQKSRVKARLLSKPWRLHRNASRSKDREVPFTLQFWRSSAGFLIKALIIWWCSLSSKLFGRPRQKDHRFKAHLHCLLRLFQNKNLKERWGIV